MPRSFVRAHVGWLVLAVLAACQKQSSGTEPAQAKPAASGEERVHGLTKEQASQPLAEMGDAVITLGEFAERLASQSPYIRARYASVERRKEFLRDMVRFELLAAEARRRGYDQHDSVKRLRRQMMVQQMMKDRFETSVKLSDIKDTQIEDYYRSNQQEFHKPEQVRASHILLKDKRAASRVLRKVQTKPTDMALWRTLAAKHSKDVDSRERGGDLRFFSRPQQRAASEPLVPAAVADAAFELKQKGDVHPTLIKSAQGYHIVKLTARRPALRRSLEDARRLIQNRLWRKLREEKIQTYVAELRKKAKVREHLEVLRDVRVDDAQAATTAGNQTASEDFRPGTGARVHEPQEARSPQKKKQDTR